MSAEKVMSCLAPETIAAFAEGELVRSEVAAVVAHLRTCMECTRDVQEANAARQPASHRTAWLAVAAAAAIVMISALLFVQRTNRIPEGQAMARLIALAPKDARLVETRLTAFAWAPYRGPMRAEGGAEDVRRLKIAGVAGDAVAQANADPSPEAQRTAGVALLFVGEAENALRRLRTAAERSPKDAAIWSDLAAALDAAAVGTERPSLHSEALAAADRALSVNPGQPEAIFNRALILEHLGLAGEARKAWDRYLALDPSSPWANEARQHLRQLPVSTGDARFRAEQSRLERAAELVSAFPQQSRTFAEAEYLGRWGESNDLPALNAARVVGEELHQRSGESLLLDSVAAIDRADDATRGQLAAAHALYRRARIALSRQEPVSAERDLRGAAAMFAVGRSPMTFVARYFVACARFEAGDAAGARQELEQLLTEAGAHPSYMALRAQIEWQLATVAMSDADWAGALERLSESERLFRRLGESANTGFVRGMQSTAMACLGRPDQAWEARIEAFAVLDAEGRADRLPVTLGGAARMELHAGRLETGRAFLRLEAESLRDTKNGALLANALVRETLLQAQLGDREAAARAAQEAMTVAASLSGPPRDIAVADASLAAGAAGLLDDPAAAGQALTRAIDFYRASARVLFLPQAYLLRARAALRAGDAGSALRDVDEGVALLERHRLRLAGPLVGTDILDAGVTLRREAIRLRMETGDVAGAFREAERRNLQTATAREEPIALDELQRRLRGTSVVVLHLTMLADEAVSIVVTESEVAAARAPLSEQKLASRIRGATAGHLDDAAVLYDALIRPSQEALSGARSLIIVADPLLQEVPYAALYDRTAKRHLIELMPVAVAESASSLRLEAGSVPRTALAVALPSGDLPALPDAERELEMVTALYGDAVSLGPAAATFAAFTGAAWRAGVVHVAGHTSRRGGANEPSFRFSDRRATWRDIAGMRFDRGAVVILSACETLCRTDAGHAGALSLGGGVLAAGAGDVIGTLTPVADRDAVELFRGVHRGLAAGLGAAEALRRAQLDELSSEVATRRASPWRAVALLTRSIPRTAH
jgi:CHAT domain-containing protein